MWASSARCKSSWAANVRHSPAFPLALALALASPKRSAAVFHKPAEVQMRLNWNCLVAALQTPQSSASSLSVAHYLHWPLLMKGSSVAEQRTKVSLSELN